MDLKIFPEQNKKDGDFPGGPVVKNLPSKAGDTGSIPGQGTKIPHAPQHNYVHMPQLEKPTFHNQRESLNVAVNSTCAAKETQHSQKKKKTDHWTLKRGWEWQQRFKASILLQIPQKCTFIMGLNALLLINSCEE